MKTLKKILSLTIVFAMVMSVVAFAGYKDVDYDEDYAGAVELLSALEIFVGDQNGNFNPDKTISRAEMAAIICRAKGLEDAAQASKGETAYTDVPAHHWASGYVNIASQTGIIAGYGNGKFGPDDDVTYEQAVKMIVCALGFEPMAKAKGGWPAGYMVVGNTYKITEGASAAQGALRKTVAVLMNNGLTTPMMDQTTWGSDAQFEVLDGSRGKLYRTLLTDMDIYVATGIVGNKAYDEIAFTISEDSDDGEFNEGDEEYFEINGTDIAGFKHQSVEAYVSKKSRNSYEVVAVVSAVEGSSFTIVSDDIESYASNKVEYFVDPANSSKTKTIKLEKNPDVEFNSSGYNGSLADLLLYEEDVELTFIENTGDNTYDAIVATKYLSAKVDYVDANKDKITIDGKTVLLDFDDEDLTIILEDMDGNKLDLYDFETDDVVAVVADNSNFKNYVDYIRIVKLDNSVIRGSVDGTYTASNGVRYVIIDGEDYIDGSSGSLGVGDEGLFYLGMTGKIISFDGSSASKDYAYVLECALSTSNFSDDLWQIKLLTSDNGVRTYTLTDDASEYFVNSYASKIDLDATTKSKQLFASLSSSQKADADRLITFKTNAKGYIKSFKPANVYGTTIKTISASQNEYNAYTQIINGAPLEDNAIVFNITNSSADNTYATDISYLVDDGKYSGFVFANEDYEYCVMVITSGDAAFSDEEGVAIATRVVTTSNKDDDPITKVTFVQNEEESYVYFDEDSENRAGSDDDYETMNVGDVFVYNANSAGYVSEYVILGSVNNDLLEVNKNAYAQFGEDVEFLYGYISNTSRKTTSRGETITINDGKEQVISIASSTNKYTYDDSGRNTIIETEDFLAGDAYYYDADSGEATFAFVKMADGFVVDIYTFGKRVDIGGYMNVVMLIDSIGTVEATDACLAKIEEAEDAYSRLSYSEKNNVRNYGVLTAARSQYETLINTNAAATTIAFIQAIGTVEADEATRIKIELAENSYNALTEKQREYVTNYSELVTARSTYNALVAQKENAKINEVIELINSIGTVDASSKAKIDAARAAYNALTETQKSGVTNYGSLESAESAYEAIVSTAAVDEVILLIDSIGVIEPTDECKDKIEAAEKAYAELGSSEKAQVNNAMDLENAKADYEKAVSAVNEVKALINAIGTVEYTDSCYAKITVAKEAYKALDTAEKYAVTNYAKLAEAEETYEALKNAVAEEEKKQTDKAEAEKVDAIISQLGTMDASEASRIKLEAAVDAYNALTTEQKAYVQNKEILTNAAAAYAKAVEDAKIAEDKQEAAKVEAIIAQIGAVDASDACKAKIEAAEKAYNDLTNAQKAYVGNVAVLTAAKTAYAKAVEDAKIAADKQEAAKVEAIIAQIGTVDASDACKAKIEAAEKAYNDLTNTQKAYVGNVAVLTAAKTAYAKAVEDAKIAADKQEAAKVEAIIAQIGAVDASDACKAKIEAAEKAYNDLTNAQKAYVGNAAVLTAAKTAYAKAVEDAKIAADKQEAAKVDELIKAIGSVDASDACKTKIEAAEKAYELLTAEQKKYVTLSATLSASRTIYNALTK